MATTDAKPVPVKGAAYRVTFPIMDADGDLVTGATGLDSEVSKDAGTFADCTNEATEIATSSGVYYLDLTSTEMNADTVAVIVKTSSSGAKTTPIFLYPQEAGDIPVTVEAMNAGTVTATAIAADAIGASELAADAVAEIQSGLATASALTTAQTDLTTLTGRLTSARAGYLDNLSAGAVATASALSSVATNVSTLVTGVTVSSIGTGVITAASIAAGAGAKIADIVLRRTTANVEASTDGDTLGGRSLYGAVARLAHKVSTSAGTMTVTKSDDTTALTTAVLTTDASADPVTTVDPAA